MTKQPLQAVIFDMDGVLIDSEPLWHQAENKIFTALGVAVTVDMLLQQTGLRIDQAVENIYQQSPWADYHNAEVSQAISSEVAQLIHLHGEPLLGAQQAIAHCQAIGLKVGLATSSSTSIINAVLAKLNLKKAFTAQQSAENLPFGKPHPEVYLTCASKLNIHPRHCLAIEDSFNGLLAARAANMQTLIIPPHDQRHDKQWVIAHHQAENLLALPQVLNDALLS